MASGVGRGRGRGRGSFVVQPDKKPGGLEKNDAPQTTEDTLSILIKSLSIEPDEAELNPVADACQKSCKEKDQIDLVVKQLYDRCCVDWHFAGTAAGLAKRITTVEADKESLRTILLRTIQADFQAKEKLREESPAKFLGCVSFLCQVLANIRDSNDQPLKPLLNPVLQACDMLLDNKATDEEMGCAALQLLAVCPILHVSADKDKMTATKNLVKDIVVGTQGTTDNRYKLLEVVEKFAALS